MKTAFHRSYPRSNSLIKLLCIFLLATSCRKEDFDPSVVDASGWNPEIAFPLAYAEIGIAELAHVNDSTITIETDPDQFCTLIYEGEAFRIDAEQLLTIPNQNAQQQIRLTNPEIATLQSTGHVQTSQNHLVALNISNGAELDTMLMKDGILTLELTSDFPANAVMEISIPSMTKNGNACHVLLPLNYQPGITATNSVDIALQGYHMDLTNGGGSHNTLNIHYQVQFSDQQNGISTSNKITCRAELSNLKYEIAYGYLGQQTISNIVDSLEISIFKNASGSGNFTIAEPSVRFDISNGFGIPVDARMHQLTALQSNLTDFTVATGIPDPLPVQCPQISEAGEIKHTSFTLNHQNSNMVPLFAEQPAYLVSQMQASLNPQGRNINFITDSSYLDIDIHAELPFYGTAKDFLIIDTVPFSYNDLDNVEELTLRINVENTFPLSSSMQVIFADDNSILLDSLFMPGEVVVPSGIINTSSQRVTIPGRKQHDVKLIGKDITDIKGATKMVVKSSATTYNNGNSNVRIYADYRLKVKIGAIAKLKINN